MLDNLNKYRVILASNSPRRKELLSGLGVDYEVRTLPDVDESYPAGLQPSRLDLWLPAFVGNRLRKGFKIFGNSARGFLTNDAVVIGVETRTSSPVRIPRDLEGLHHVCVKGLYPCGEGAGYAGGIVSAAIDGERCAEALAADISRYGV